MQLVRFFEKCYHLKQKCTTGKNIHQTRTYHIFWQKSLLFPSHQQHKPFFKNHKNVYFPNVFPKTDLAKSSRDKKFQLEERNTVVIFQRVLMLATCAAFGCTNSRKNSSGLTFNRIHAANAQNKLLQQRWIQKHSSRRSLAKG